MLGKTEGRRRRGQQRMRWLGGIIDSMDMSLRKFQETGKPGMLQSVWSQRVRHDFATENQINDENRCKTSQQNSSKQNPTTYESDHAP